MTLSQMQDFTFKHSDQQDAIYTQYTAQQIKAFFDSRGDELRTALNSLINTLNSSDGANNISATPIAVGSGATVQEQLAWLLSQIAIAATGSIPATSITEDKLALALLDKINKALSNTGVLTTLLTTDQSSLVNALNEHYVDDVSHVKYATSTGTANTYAVTLDPAPTSYVEGMAVSVKINIDSNAASTINVNGLGAKGIKKANGTDVTNLKANGIYTLRYDGVNFILQGEGGSGNATASDLLSGKTASTDAGDIVGTIPSKGAQTYTPGTSNQTIASNQYLTGTQTIAGDADLIAGNIKSGVNVFGVLGSLVPLTTERKWASGTATASSSLISFEYVSGATVTRNSLTVSGLDFTPTHIIAMTTGASHSISTFTSLPDVFYGNYAPTVRTSTFDDRNATVTLYSFKGNVSNAYANFGGFQIPTYASGDHSWIAFA